MTKEDGWMDGKKERKKYYLKREFVIRGKQNKKNEWEGRTLNEMR